MASDEQFSLCWNNFHTNMSSGFHNLLSRGDLVDVTLAAEGRLLQAHKLVLSVCSPYFQEMFKLNPSQHPIVFLKDVSHSALRDLLQFMYQGEVNVKQEELASFISTAEQLQVKGLTGNQNEDSSTPASKPKPSSRPGPRSQQRQSLKETDLDSRSSNPVAVKRPNRPSITPSNPQSSQPAPAKRKCLDPLEAGPSGAAKEEFVTIPDDDDSAVAPKMEPEFVNESLWEDDDDGTNNDDGNFEDDSNMEMSGFDGSVTGDTSIAGATGEGGAVGDAQDNSRQPITIFFVETGGGKKRSRKSITLETKLDVLRRIEASEKVVDICKELGLPRSTVKTIRANKEKIYDLSQSAAPSSFSKLTRQRSGFMEKMEKLLITWIDDNNLQMIPMSQSAIQKKAKKIYEELKKKDPMKGRTDEKFMASHGWFENFKIRHGLQNVKIETLSGQEVDL